MRLCPTCNESYAKNVTFCPKDGARLGENVEASLVGETLEERYRLEAMIGAGGLGQVYRARHLRMDKAFAVKLLLPTSGPLLDIRRRFDREARALSRLTHPFCVAVTDYGFSAPHGPYIVMELVEGTQLSHYTRGEGLPLGEAIDLIGMVLKALAHAHEQGIAHRDLKPDNIMLVENPLDPGQRLPKILDFGLAKIHASFDEQSNAQSREITHAGLIIGTPHYMAPERIHDAKTADDALGDVYAVGVLLYELCCGVRPFVDDDIMGVLTKHLSETPRPPSLLRPELPAELEKIILQALEKDPKRRIPSAAAFASALEALPPLDASLATAPPRTRAPRPTGDMTKAEQPARIIDGGAESFPLAPTLAAPSGSIALPSAPQTRPKSAPTPRGGARGQRRRAVIIGFAIGGAALLTSITVAAVFLLSGDGDQRHHARKKERKRAPTRIVHRSPPSKTEAPRAEEAPPRRLPASLRAATRRWERASERGRRRISRSFARYLPRHPADVEAHLHVGRLYLYSLWVDDGLKVIETICKRKADLRLDDATLVALTLAYRTKARRRARALLEAHAGDRVTTVLLVGAAPVSNKRHKRRLIAEARARGASASSSDAALLALAEASTCKARRAALAKIERAKDDPLLRIMLALLEHDRCLRRDARKMLRG